MTLHFEAMPIPLQNTEQCEQGNAIDALTPTLALPVLIVFDQIRHKMACTAIADGLKLEISDLRKKVVYCPCSKTKG